MRFQHVAEQIYSKPWLITPSAHTAIVRLFESKYASSCTFDRARADDGDTSAFYVQRTPASLDVNGIGHVHIKGIVGQGLSRIEKSCGNTDTRDILTEIADLLQQGAKGLLITIDSPGGTITGTPEIAEAVANAALAIPVFVFSDSRICSAAYWHACGATRIVCTDSAEIGSIGAYMPWIDRSAQWEQEGLKADPVINTGGTYKATGFGPSLSDVQREQLQQYVDKIFGMFRNDVVQLRALHEAVVPDSALQGQVFLGADALENGLVDAIGSLEDAYEALLMEIDIDEEPEEPDQQDQQDQESPAPTDSTQEAAPAPSTDESA